MSFVESNTFNQPIQASSDKPIWFDNPKRRTIPNHLILKKKTGFLKTNDNKADFNSISFKQKNLSSSFPNSDGFTLDSSSYNNLLNSNSSTHIDDDDIPPTKSIYDFTEDTNETKTQEDTWNSKNSFINKDPKNYLSIFKKPDSINKETGDRPTDNGNITASSSSSLLSANTAVAPANTSLNPISQGESAILVFGYPESMSNQVISHFANFGNILEDFDIIRKSTNFKNQVFHNSTNLNKPNRVPIFIGDSWLKITYDNPSSGIRALEENGTFFNGSLLGVVPYTRHAIEKLQNRVLGDDEDIGDASVSYQNLSFINSNGNFNNHILNDYKSKRGEENVDRVMELKDGKSFFKSDVEKIEKKDEIDLQIQNGSFFAKITNLIFGFNEL